MKHEIENWFTYHPPSPEQIPAYNTIREAGKHLATLIDSNCPPCADTTAAIRKVREAVFSANAAIACAPRVMGYSPEDNQAKQPYRHESEEMAIKKLVEEKERYLRGTGLRQQEGNYL